MRDISNSQFCNETFVLSDLQLSNNPFINQTYCEIHVFSYSYFILIIKDLEKKLHHVNLGLSEEPQIKRKCQLSASLEAEISYLMPHSTCTVHYTVHVMFPCHVYERWLRRGRTAGNVKNYKSQVMKNLWEKMGESETRSTACSEVTYR